jgi:predicted nucleotidyltransferase
LSLRLELARDYVRSFATNRPDLRGALVYASVAQGIDTDLSDIDVCVLMERMPEDAFRLSEWRDGHFLHVIPVPWGQVLPDAFPADQFAAAYLNEGLVIYDSTGDLTRAQRTVRQMYMSPGQIASRIGFAMGRLRNSVAGLPTVLSENDPSKICGQVLWIVLSAASVPMYLAKESPSGMRKLSQLLTHDAPLRQKLMSLESSMPEDLSEVQILRTLCTELDRLRDEHYGNATAEYTLWRVDRLIERGRLVEAVDGMWWFMIKNPPRESCAVESQELHARWLATVGWDGMHQHQMRLAECRAVLEHLESRIAGS